jgi:signal transduction histidine kinase
VSALYAWWRNHPRVVDGVLATPLALSGLGDAVATRHYLLILAALGLTIPIVVRRGHPVGAFSTAILIGAIQVILGVRPIPSDLAILVLLYTLAAYTTRRISVSGLGICLYGALVETFRLHTRAGPLSSVNYAVLIFVMFAGPTLIAWVLGDSTSYRRAYYLNLEERAARLERDRDAHARIAAAAERARIARELHDVVAHNVSVMVVQADGAAYALGADPERARDALAAISATGRQALTEMRALLGVLRQGDGGRDPGPEPRPAVLAPLPDLGQLDELLDQTRATGLGVSYRAEGVPRPLNAGTALTVYRIIQESLTNTRKHAGPLAAASVVLRYTDDTITVTVTDNGVGSAAPCDGAGHGLTGMTERAVMYGGSVQVGPRPGGGFGVTATLPIAAVSLVPVSAGAVSAGAVSAGAVSAGAV